MEVIAEKSFQQDFEKVPPHLKKQVAKLYGDLQAATNIDAASSLKYFYKDKEGRYYYPSFSYNAKSIIVSPFLLPNNLLFYWDGRIDI